jgi:uncharacterized damage-inducible protein DinB
MTLNQILLPEFDHEMANTRRALARVPGDRLDWSPHPKSMTLGRLASHLAEFGDWAAQTCEQEELDLSGYQPPVYSSTAEILETFDANVAAGRAALAAASDELLKGKWSLRSGGHAVFTMPRAAVLRSFVLSHLIHHRGQLSVYLRLLDLPVPALYGPSADERPA